MHLLLVGATGQLGCEISSHPDILKNHTLSCLSHRELDITDSDAILRACAQYMPDLIINAAAYTKVDQAEIDVELAYAINAQGAGNLAQICEKLRIPLIHFSTDYLFDGEKSTPYTEEDKPSPLNIYGDSKWQGEVLVRQHCSKHIILRVSWLFGIYGHNFFKTMLNLAREKKEIKVVNDQYGSPTPTFSIANALYLILQKIASSDIDLGETYHFCGTPSVSWYEFAKTIIHTAARFETLKVENILPISTLEYPTPARRPKNSFLSCEKITTTLGISQPNWAEILPDLVLTIQQRGLFS